MIKVDTTPLYNKNDKYSLFFFFSSRRRHTRCSRDWSSDVCSSDLAGLRHGLSPGSLNRARDAKIGNDRVPGGDENVLGFDVTVDHALLVGVLQGIGHFPRDDQRLLHRELRLPDEPVA